MAITKEDLTKAILHGQLTDQQVAYIQRDIMSYMPTYTAPFETFYDHRSIPEGYTSVQFKRLIPKIIKPGDTENQFLGEDIAPAPETIQYATYSKTARVLRRKYIYTDFDVRQNFTNILNDINRTLGNELAQDRSNILASGLLSTRTYATPTMNDSAVDWDANLRRMKTVLLKNFAKTIDGMYYILVTPEIGDELAKMIESKGAALAENVKEKLSTGDVFDYYGFRIRATNHPALYRSNGDMSVLFIGNAPDGTKPAWDYGSLTPEIIAKGLGQGGELLLDQNGDLTADGNNQRGSVAANMYGVAAGPVCDSSIIRMDISGVKAVVDNGVIDITDPTVFTGFVSKSHSPSDTTFYISSDNGNTLSATGANGKPRTLTLTLTKGLDVTDTVNWTSGTPATATVDDGVVTAVAAGNTVITAKAGTHTATFNITVVA